MRVLWICNIMLPMIAERLGCESSNKEGWLSGLAAELLERQRENNIELHTACPVSREQDGSFHKIETESGVLYAHGFYEDTSHAERYDKALEERIGRIIRRVNPDVVHCFGTEYGHTLAAVRSCRQPRKLLVGIQGVCSVIAEAYMADLPLEVQKKDTFRDWLKQDGLRKQQEKFALRGKREREILGKAENITGRTEFDKAFAAKCNPSARYFSMNETLRGNFYEGEWSREGSVPHRIFLSQGDYPLKGLHYMLIAAGRLKEDFPDLQIRVAGSSLVNYAALKDKIKISGYGSYLRKLIAENGLEKHISFLGKLSPEEMKAEYLKCSLYVCCSANENSPNSLGEAMLLGVPCVAARVGGIPDMLEDGKEGILYGVSRLHESKYNNKCNEKEGLTKNAGNLYNSVLEMWSNPEKQEEYRKNARIHAQKTHDREENYKKLLEIYAKIAADESDSQESPGKKICFVSNYINHHQIPFCNAMQRLTGGSFTFIQTRPMEEERIKMGWQKDQVPEYVREYEKETEWCRKHILDCDVVLFGGCDEEHYIEERLQSGKIIIRISERLYKTGQWKAVSPRGLLKKYHDHTRYRRKPVYLLCAGAYVASDFRIVKAYPGKMFCWGYFPETRQYDVEKLLEKKGYLEEKPEKGIARETAQNPSGERIPYLLWAGRFIHWKHPELALETAAYLKKKGLGFHLDMIGGGEMEGALREKLSAYGLEDCVSLLGFKTPMQVREFMERADVFLFTSDRQEGWGAVLNEAMNSACAVAADSLPGAVPYLIRHGENGLIYSDRHREGLFELTERLVRDKKLRREMGGKAYETILQVWNADNAARQLLALIEELEKGENEAGRSEGDESRLSCKGGETKNSKGTALWPCAPAPIIGEGKFTRA